MSIIDNAINALSSRFKATVSGKALIKNSEIPAAKSISWPTRPSALAQRLVDNTDLTNEELFSGIVYRALTVVANRTAQVLLENTVVLDNNGEEVDRENHPYWNAIDNSPSFTNFEFFYALATYLQLPGGFAPILAVRNYTQGRDGRPTTVGDIKEFRIVSPYNLTILTSDEDGRPIGYEETITVNGQLKTRKLGLPHIIPVKTFNPFNNVLGFGATQAAKEYQYTSKAASRYTRRSMRNNISTSGILTVNKVLDEPARKQFREELKARYASEAADGSPIVAFGADALAWADIRQDMDKMALEKVHNLTTEDLISVLGVSKTILGIEQSGVTRETSKVQQDLLMLNTVMPLANSIINEINQDYRNSYPNQWKANKLTLVLESPVSKDYEAEKIQAETESIRMDTARKMWDMGASRESIMEALELPEELEFDSEPRWGGLQNPLDDLLAVNPTSKVEAITVNSIPDAKNALTGDQFVMLREMRDKLIEDVAALDLSTQKDYIEAVDKATTNSLLPESDKEKYVKKMSKLLSSYYYVIVPLIGKAVAEFRRKQYGLPTEFDLTKDIKKLISDRVGKTAAAHFDFVDQQMTKILKDGLDKGLGRDQIAREIRSKFNDQIAKSDARRLAVTETNNAFNKSQFWADREFINQNSLETRAYKQWVTYSPNPCPFCVAMEQQPPIPFDQAFLRAGQSLDAEFALKDGQMSVRSLTADADFGDIEDGNLHPNCSCKYRLILRSN